MPAPPLSHRLTSAPDSDEGRALRARLSRRDREDWPWLLEGLREIARGLAPAYRDVCSADDLLGELALRTHERWLEEWLGGPGDVSLGLFLRDRLRDHLRDLRRRAERRGALLGGAVPGTALVETDAGARSALLATEAPSPEQALEAREIERALGAESATLVGLRAAGFEHAEIASQTGLSRQTVGRRLGALLTVLAALAATALLITYRADPEVPIDRDPSGLGVAVPAGEADAGVPLDAAVPDDTSEPSSDAAASVSSGDATDAPAANDTGKPADAPPGETEDEGVSEVGAIGPLRVPEALLPPPSRRLPTTAKASAPAFRAARSERLRVAIALCRREPGGSVRIELLPGEPEDVGVDRVDRACVTAAVRAELGRGRPDQAQTFRFFVDDDRAVRPSR